MSTAANPRAPKPDPSDIPQEPTGPVAADSLAAESNKAGGGFSENENVAQLSVKGGQSTLANTDTSGATALHAASSGAAREAQDAKGLGSDERGVTGVKYPDAAAPEFTGTHSLEGYVGGPSADRDTSQTSAPAYSGATGDSFADGGSGLTGSSATKTAGISSGGGYSGQTDSGSGSSGGSYGGNYGGADVETAPTYAATVTGALRTEGELQPKGTNLTEGDIPRTKTFTGNVGGDKDPGRLAEAKFEKINADTAGGLKYGSEGTGDRQGNQYDVLESERA